MRIDRVASGVSRQARAIHPKREPPGSRYPPEARAWRLTPLALRRFVNGLHYGGMAYYRRRLPHWTPRGKAVFVTFRLCGSLPAQWTSTRGLPAGREFVELDRVLDRSATGPRWLARQDVARVVVEAIEYGSETLQRYVVYAYVVMVNHVHLLIEPGEELIAILRTLKGYSARQANALIGRRGPFWERESFDHWVRDESELRRIAWYIENNPVAAGVVARAEDYLWSSASGVSHQARAARG